MEAVSGLQSELLLKQGQLWGEVRLHRAWSTQVLKISKDWEWTNNLGNLLLSWLSSQWRNFFLYQSPLFQLTSLASFPPNTAWLCLTDNLPVGTGSCCYVQHWSHLSSKLSKSCFLSLSSKDVCTYETTTYCT